MILLLLGIGFVAVVAGLVLWIRSRPVPDQHQFALEELEAFKSVQLDVSREGPWADEVTVIIKAFERPICAIRAVISVRQFFPTIRVLVCDDSRKPLFEDGAEPLPGVCWLTVDFELGHTLGAGRNHLLDRTETRYFFLMDDDHEITEGSRLEDMTRFLEEYDYDIVGGAQGTSAYGAAIFEQDGDVVQQRFSRYHEKIADGVVSCDRVSNTFMGRTEAARKVYWEGRVYAAEHADFFLRASRADLKIAQMGETWVEHDRGCEVPVGILGALSLVVQKLIPHRDRRYRKMRSGDSEAAVGDGQSANELYRRYVLEKNGISAIVDSEQRDDRENLMSVIGRPDARTR